MSHGIDPDQSYELFDANARVDALADQYNAAREELLSLIGHLSETIAHLTGTALPENPAPAEKGGE
ncbi:hypothetical protein D7U36_02995 [Propionibacterium australiense]|uniref:Uncharacterized protein n=1 Tax=Propionibacterium australiense TaxID=119981 RepID=A0A8B3FNZ3_9ACTN|nr:hypothetical protein D7U36_02995 [Propionibacterium australiense]